MSEQKHPLEKITALRYKNYFLMTDTMRDNDNLIAVILRVHLVSEYLLEELIRFVFEEKADAILSIGLRYQQKLELVSKLELVEDWELLPDFVVVSLKKLNKLRNRVAHRLNEKIIDDEIRDLFMGLEDELPYQDISEFGSVTAMKRYLAFIYGCMLPKFEKTEESPIDE